MKHFLITIIILLSAQKMIIAQTNTVNVGITNGFVDSTYVIQTGTTDSFHNGNHPGAAAFYNGEIYMRWRNIKI
jgi:hypothetical protein